MTCTVVFVAITVILTQTQRLMLLGSTVREIGIQLAGAREKHVDWVRGCKKLEIFFR